MDTNGKCPPEVAEAVLKIIETAILSIRFAAWNGQVEYCAIEANHVHNLPKLILDFTPDRLSDYVEAVRLDYIDQMNELGGFDPKAYTDQWKQLEKCLNQIQSP